MTTFKLKRFIVSRFSAALGDQFMLFAVPLLVLKTTGSVAYSGLAFMIEWLPRLIFLPVAGTLADRVNVQKLYRWADGGRAAAVLTATALISALPSRAFLVLSAMMATLAVLNSLAFVGMEATLPRQLPPEEMPKAQSILQGCDQLSQALGPAVAGLAASFLKLQWLLPVGAAFFSLSLLNSFGLPALQPAAKKAERGIRATVLDSYRTGWAVLWSQRILFQICALTWIVNVMWGTVLVINAAVITQTFGRPDHDFALLQTTAAVLGLSAFTVTPKLAKTIGLAGLGILAFSMMSGGALAAAMAPGFLAYGLGAVTIMAADGMFNVYIRSLRAQVIPKEHFGKTTGLIILINNCSLPISGACVSFFSGMGIAPQGILLTMTLISLALGAGVLWLGRRAFKYPTIMPSLPLPAAA